MITVVTGWSPQGLQQYAYRFIETFDRYWPSSVRLIAYVEEKVDLPRGECRLLSEIPGCMEFLERNDTPMARGREPHKDWFEKDIRNGYTFRFDAWKFCRQGFIPYHAAQGLEGTMIWLDADVVTFRPVPEGFIEQIVKADVTYLGRKKHSEIGFVGYRLPAAMPLLKRFYDYYNTDEVFSLREWHSAYVFDRAREESGVDEHNMTPGDKGNVWNNTPLRKYMAHLKGNLKKIRNSDVNGLRRMGQPRAGGVSSRRKKLHSQF